MNILGSNQAIQDTPDEVETPEYSNGLSRSSGLQDDRHATEVEQLALLKTPSLTPGEAAAENLLLGQASQFGCAVEDIAAYELGAGKIADPRVSEEQMALIAGHYTAAQAGFFADLESRAAAEPLKLLLAPTARVVDYIIDERAVYAMVHTLIAEGRKEQLLHAIDRGPGDGGIVWEKPADPVELVAGILRWAVIREGDKKRIRTSPEIRNWIGRALEEEGCDSRSQLGGVSAVGTLLARVLGREPSMLALGKLPPEILEHMAPDTRIVGSDPAASLITDLPLEPMRGGHYCLSFYGRPLLLPSEVSEVSVNGDPVRTSAVTRIDFLITGSSAVSGFADIGPERMRELGRTHSLMALSGLQSLGTDADIRDYFAQVREAHAEGMPVALLYSETKFPEKEPEVWRELKDRRCVEFLGMNTGESFDILSRIADDARGSNRLGLSAQTLARIERTLETGRAEAAMWENGRESPQWLFQSATLLQELLEIPVVRVRGKASDVLVVAKDVPVEEPDRIRSNLIVSRNMGTLKVANEYGLLKDASQLAILKNPPHGEYLAAMHILSDEIAAFNLKYGDELGGTGEISTNCYTRLADGRFCFAVPPVPFYARRGGTQSAGDTIDVTFVTLEAEGLLRSAADALDVRMTSRQ